MHRANMRSLQRLRAAPRSSALRLSLRGLTGGMRSPASRNAVLTRWIGNPPSTKSSATAHHGILGKGLSFASGLLRDASPSTRQAATNSTSDATVGDVPWDLCERMDYYVQYNVPSTWQVAEVLRDNSIAIQCSPPLTAEVEEGAASVHGISLNCFAYKQRVKELDSTRLLHVFLRRFNASVGNSVQILSEGQPPSTTVEAKLPPRQDDDAKATEHVESEDAEENICQRLAKQLSSAVAEVTFTPAPGQPLAHGLCRALYNSNGRFHYVMVVAVPEEEYDVSLDLMVHALASVVESRVEAAAKRT